MTWRTVSIPIATVTEETLAEFPEVSIPTIVAVLSKVYRAHLVFERDPTARVWKIELPTRREFPDE